MVSTEKHPKAEAFFRSISWQSLTWIVLILIVFSPSLSVSAKTPIDLLKNDWIEVKTENFHIITDLKVKYAKAFAIDLEQFRYYLT